MQPFDSDISRNGTGVKLAPFNLMLGGTIYTNSISNAQELSKYGGFDWDTSMQGTNFDDSIIKLGETLIYDITNNMLYLLKSNASYETAISTADFYDELGELAKYHKFTLASFKLIQDNSYSGSTDSSLLATYGSCRYNYRTITGASTFTINEISASDTTDRPDYGIREIVYCIENLGSSDLTLTISGGKCMVEGFINSSGQLTIPGNKRVEIVITYWNDGKLATYNGGVQV